MLHTVPQDRKVLEANILKVLTQAKGRKFIFVDTRDFYRDMRFSKLKQTQFAAEVGDVLSCAKLCRNHGVWVFTEYGDGVSVFCCLTTVSGYSEVIIPALEAAGLALNLTHFGEGTTVEDLGDEDLTAAADEVDDGESTLDGDTSMDDGADDDTNSVNVDPRDVKSLRKHMLRAKDHLDDARNHLYRAEASDCDDA